MLITVIIVLLIIFVLLALFPFTDRTYIDPNKKREYFLVLICRVRNERKNMEGFIPYYLNQGVDKIYLLDDGSTEKYDVEKYGGRIEIITDTKAREMGNQKYDTKKLHSKIRHECEWMIVVDADEFIHTRHAPHKTIRRELETTFKSADCVLVPWVMFGSSGNIEEVNPLMKCIHRWNHDKKHPHPYGYGKARCRYENIEVKSIFKPYKFKSINNHTPEIPLIKVKVVDGVRNNVHKLEHRYKNLREKDIKEAIIICNHYRTSSVKYIEKKCRPDTMIKNYIRNTENCIRDIMASDYNDIEDTYLRDREKPLFLEDKKSDLNVSHEISDHSSGDREKSSIYSKKVTFSSSCDPNSSNSEEETKYYDDYCDITSID